MVKAKYQKVLDLGEKLEIKNGDVKVENGVLQVHGTAKNQYHKNLIWDAIKEAGGENPSDIMADIKVENTSVFAHHTVSRGETLSKIAKHYYGDPMKYPKTFEANKHILKSADVIHPDQELIIPHL